MCWCRGISCGDRVKEATRGGENEENKENGRGGSSGGRELLVVTVKHGRLIKRAHLKS